MLLGRYFIGHDPFLLFFLFFFFSHSRHGYWPRTWDARGVSSSLQCPEAIPSWAFLLPSLRSPVGVAAHCRGFGPCLVSFPPCGIPRVVYSVGLGSFNSSADGTQLLVCWRSRSATDCHAAKSRPLCQDTHCLTDDACADRDDIHIHIYIYKTPQYINLNYFSEPKHPRL